MSRNGQGFLHKTANFFIGLILCRGELEKDAMKTKKASYKELFRFASPNDRICIVLGCLAACIGGINQPMVQTLGGMISNVFLKERDNVGNLEFLYEMQLWLILLAVCGTISFISTFLQSWLLHRGSQNMINTIRREYLAAVLRQDAAWFGDTNSGAIISVLNTNIQKIEEGLGEKLGSLIRGISMFTWAVLLCLWINWQLTLVSITMGPITAWTLSLLGKIGSGYKSKISHTAHDAATIVEESVMNHRTVAACNAQYHMVKKYETILDGIVSPNLKYNFWAGFIEGMTYFQFYTIIGIAFWLGAYGYFNGWITRPGDVLLVTATVFFSGYYLGLLGPHMMTILKARMAMAQLYDIIDRKNNSEFEYGIVLKDPKGEIEVNDVIFSYPGRDLQVLKGITWNAKNGESIGLVGKSGCGKSTSIGLLTKLYTANSGDIKIDGVSINRTNLSSFRKMIGIVEQEPYLFNGTVLENILLGRDGLTVKNARQAAATANAEEFIQKLPQLGIGGITLSGGQKQRIAIARAIATDPKILLLDEATSALDTESERIVQAALNKAAKGRTTIFIAHRLSTLKDVDRIYVLQDGWIMEQGSHDHLIQKGGIYANLARAQEVDKKEETERSNVRREKSLRKRSHNELPGEEKCSEDAVPGKAENNLSNGLHLLYSNMGSHWPKALGALVFSLIRGLEMPMFAYANYLSFYSLQSKHRDNYMYNGLMVFLFSLFMATLCQITHTGMYALSGWTSEKVMAMLKVRALKSLLHKSCTFFDQPQTSPAACVSKISQHAPNCIPALNYQMTRNLSYGTGVIVGLLLTFIFSWELGLLAMFLCCFLFILAISNFKRVNSARKRKEIEDHSGTYCIEIVEQARAIQLLAVEDHFLQKYSYQLDKSLVYERRIGTITAVNMALGQSFLFFADLSYFILAAYLIYWGKTPVETAFLAFMGSRISGRCIMFTSPFIPDVVKASSSARELFKLIDDEMAIKNAMDEGEKPEIHGKVTVSNVDFAYPIHPNHLVSRQLSFTAKKGESVALVGASGCGKSTVISLLERFYTTNKGQIKIDDKDILSLNLAYLRQNIALVSQEPVLVKAYFSVLGSILENITMGMGEVQLEKVIDACRTANAAKFIESFPEGYETDVGEKGRNLSGGQKQRIAIARAMVRNPRIILLDEATSALDTESENLVQKALNDASLGRTSITIAHRLSSIQHCNRIYVIEDGSVVEAGTHQELLQLDGKYARLVEAQQLNAT